MAKKFLCIILILMLAGCTNYFVKFRELKEEREHTESLILKGDLEYSKKIVKEVIAQMGLVERKDLETNNFIFANMGYGDYLKVVFVPYLVAGSILGAGMPGYTSLGIFFEHDKDENLTTIFVTEDTPPMSHQYRFYFIDKIKLKNLEG